MVTIRVAVSLSKTRAVFLQQNLTRLILQQTFFQWRSKGRSSSLKISSYSLCFTEAFMCENWTLDYYSWHRFQTTKHQFLRHTPFPKTERITDEGSIRFLRSQGFLWAWDRKNEYPLVSSRWTVVTANPDQKAFLVCLTRNPSKRKKPCRSLVFRTFKAREYIRLAISSRKSQLNQKFSLRSCYNRQCE